MDGMHDLGGMQGFGVVERDEAVFHEPWERRAFGIAQTVHIVGNSDDFRHSIERLHPAQYLTVGYWGRWLASTEIRLLERSLIDSDDVDARAGSTVTRPHATVSVGLPTAPATAPGVRRQVDRAPHFRVGQAVRVRNLHPVGHTRLPGYVRGHAGIVAIVHPGAFVYPDANAHGRGEDPQHVYAVQFLARSLWGTGDHHVVVDLFEPYLEAVG